MSKTKILALIVLVVLVGGYLAFKGDKTIDTINIYNNSGEVKNDTGKKMAFSEFIKNPNGSYKCEVKQAFSDMENSGTVYISDGKIKGDYTTIAEGKTVKTSFIMRDGYSYMWGDMMAGSGFKVKIPEGATTGGDPSTSTSGTYSWNAEQIGDYNCESWTATDAMFKLPTNITFKDLTEISTAPNPIASSGAAMCSASKGTWQAEYKECNGISEDVCKAIGGTYDGCASACRHDPKAELCTMQCVQICTLK